MSRSQTNLNSIHSDVLFCPIPDEPEAQNSLLDEVLSRATDAFRLKAYHDANLLYSRALKLDPKANIYANRSLTNLKQGQYQQAVKDAECAIDLDPTWPKAYYRKAQAYEMMESYRKALEYYHYSLDKTNDLDTQNPDGSLVKCLEGKIKQLTSLVNQPNGDNEANNVTTMSNRIPPTGNETKYVYRDEDNDSNDSENSEDNNDNNDNNGLEMRGYRVREDGSKTTFFNHEMSEEERQLIGDVRPQKIK